MKTRLIALTLFALCGWLGSAQAQEPLFTGSDLSVEEAELVAREAYSRLQSFTATAGSNLHLEVSDFHTLADSELDTVLWLDLVTMPGGPMVDVHRGTQSKGWEGLDSERRVEYRPSWNDDGVDYLITDEGSQLFAMTARELLDRVSQERDDYTEIQAITSYAVRATMDGRERSYRAAMLWSPSKGAGTGLIFVDHVTQGVQDAALEELAPVTAEWRAAQPQAPPGIWEGQGPAPVECHPFRDPITAPYRVERAVGHFWGSHKLSGSFSVDCACAYDCSSSCNARVNPFFCTDSGFLRTACHMRGVGSDGSDVRGYGGGQTCAAGVMCGITPCLFCHCSVQVSVAILGSSVRFVGGGTLDTMKRQVQQTCPPCVPCN